MQRDYSRPERYFLSADQPIFLQTLSPDTTSEEALGRELGWEARTLGYNPSAGIKTVDNARSFPEPPFPICIMGTTGVCTTQRLKFPSHCVKYFSRALSCDPLLTV